MQKNPAFGKIVLQRDKSKLVKTNLKPAVKLVVEMNYAL